VWLVQHLPNLSLIRRVKLLYILFLNLYWKSTCKTVPHKTHLYLIQKKKKLDLNPDTHQESKRLKMEPWRAVDASSGVVGVQNRAVEGL
jgi:hypothetical protein